MWGIVFKTIERLSWSLVGSTPAGSRHGFLCFVSCLAAFGASPEWSVARSPHFEIYSQAGPERARFTLQRFEELRAFFDQNRIVEIAPVSPERPPVRVVEFQTAKQYEAVKLRPTADAYYTGTADRDYIVMPIFARDDFSVAAHEYAHYVLHSGGLQLPPWLSEGLAELMSTVTITNRRCELGGAIPQRMVTLRRHAWTTELWEAKASARETRDGAAIFYAESWALTDMLTSAPAYAPKFGELVAALNSGLTSQDAVAKVYDKSSAAILNDAQQWIRRGASPRRKLSPLDPSALRVEAYPATEQQAQSVIAELLLTNGDWERAGQIYRDLLRQSPNDPDLLASLGAVSLKKGEPHEAADYWRKALEAGLNNATLCYQYALLADQINLGPERIEQALELAITLRPKFNEARFKLAILKSNAGGYAGAVTQLQAMTNVLPARAFSYWSALSYALEECGKRNEAEAAAEQARHFATNTEEQRRADKLAYIAKTELSVQFTRDAEGKLQLVTTRIPHGASGINPFVEAEDHIQIASGHLREVQCADGKLTGFLIESTHGKLTLSVADPTHVLIRNGASEFTCGPQSAMSVKVEYATTEHPDRGLLRGMEF